jgi:hypothetical protein
VRFCDQEPLDLGCNGGRGASANGGASSGDDNVGVASFYHGSFDCTYFGDVLVATCSMITHTFG